MRQRGLLLLSLALLALGWPVAATVVVPVEQVPNPRPHGWTMDLTALVPPPVRAEIDAIAERVNAETGGEMALVVVYRTGAEDPRTYALRLFEHWGVGGRETNDGTLLFLAIDDRAAEIVLGDGFADPAHQAASDRLMVEEMVPRFREGRFGDGLLAGARGLAEEVYGVAVPAPAGTMAADGTTGATEPGRNTLPLLPPPPRSRVVEEHLPVSRPSNDLAKLLTTLLMLSSAAGAVFLFVRRKPHCATCGTKRVKLDEAVEDAFLSEGAQFEESIGSVQHEVWVCRGCGDALEVQRQRWLSGHGRCRECGLRTWRSTRRVVELPTEWSEGLAREEGHCAHCGHSESAEYRLARLWRSSTSEESSGSLFGGSGSRSGRGSSGGGSSRGSFGGGRSSGGGSSGRW